jgi:protein-tyrosine phosphatase
MGIGRSALLCVCILVAQGVCVEKAIERLLIGRGTDVPDTPEQLDWIRQFPAKLKAFGTAGLL